MTSKTSKRILIILLGSLLLMPLLAQKKVLDHDVYDTWKSLSSISISDDGKYGATLVNEQEGDNHLIIRNLTNNKQLIIPRAYTYKITPDNKQIVGLIKASYADIRQAKIKKVAEEKMPKDSLIIVDLSTFSKNIIPNVKDFKLGKKASISLVYRIDDSLKTDKKSPKPYALVVRSMMSGVEDSIKNVTDYLYSENGNILLANIKSNPKDSLSKNQILIYDLAKSSKRILSAGKTTYKQLSISESGQNIAFLATADSLKKEIKDYALYTYSLSDAFVAKNDSAILLVDKTTKGMPKDWNVSEHYRPHFSKNEHRLLLGTAPITLPKDTLTPAFEKAELDIWHWNTPEIPPQELANLNKKLKESYLACVDLSTYKLIQLGTEEVPNVTISEEGNGKYALGTSHLPYMLETQWDVLSRTSRDIWVFDLEKNTSKKIKTGMSGIINLSYKGKYLTWYDMEDIQYYSYSLDTDKEVCMTTGSNIIFWNEKHDTPSIPYPYGVAAWMENDEAILVYDAFDIWKLDPTGNKKPENITNGAGRRNSTRLRYVKTDPDSKYITASENILLSAFNEKTKEGGYYKISKNKVQPLVMDKYRFYALAKAKNKNSYLFSKGNFETSIDLYSTTNDWKSEKKISNINPQMKDYNWGTAELMSWTTYDGKQTEGIVYKPENFDPKKKYPVMIYFYEQLSENLYSYMPPTPSRSIINIPFYCSRGYIVFTPDIQYADGHPGESAYNSIVSGAKELAKNGWVDEKNMAIQGQSWGGYQVAYLVTRTNMFKAAGSGAPVSNMFSAYGGIRWGTGNSRQYQYEAGQSRIGATIWDNPELYIENSPIFHANKVETPLLIMHNDKDEAVPWYQGIEYFMVLRRLQKPVWMLQYNNETHNLKERKNAKDLVVRWQQFFDHYLKGEPLPVWMSEGVKAVDKGQKYGLEYIK